MRNLFVALLLFISGLSTPSLSAQRPVNPLFEFNGFFDFSYHHDSGKVKLKVQRATQLEVPFLYINGLSAGIGSNDIGLDRGQLGQQRIVHFKKMGDKLMLVQPNLRYRSSSNNPLEQQSIREAFAQSVLYGFTIEETTPTHYIIDITPFLLQDTHGVAQRLKGSKQGSYRLDPQRSAVALERTNSFPLNAEFDVMLTFAGEDKGQWIRSVTPSPNSITVHQHHSFVALPETPMTPRVFDPRAGGIPFDYYDYSTPINTSTRKVYARRHRLEKKNPEAAVSEPVEPIVYYLDNGTPEPVRSALLEGGAWWNEAFESAGFKNAFQIKILPDDADPMDVRYNVIQWVHRSTRGWSYGASVIDPRTGEILKGHVSLGSLRIRQDFLLAQAFTASPYAGGKVDDQPMMDFALARIRQLSAHEIGHTLGFAHNFAASTFDRSSVMDYPHPTLGLSDGKIDYTNAYATGIGEWDKITVQYAYTDFPDGTQEEKALRQLLNDSYRLGHRFITDRDARAQGGAHPKAHLWDNGTSATKELRHLLNVRQVAFNQFSVDQLKNGQPLSHLRDRFVPVYFLHRYQLEAAVKLVGGQDYDYNVKGGVAPLPQAIAAKDQREALQAMVETLSPAVLTIPTHIRALMPPFAFGHGASRESFNTKTGLTFDVIGAAETLTDQTMHLLLHPQRVARLYQQGAIDQNQLSLSEVMQALIKITFLTRHKDPLDQALQAIVQGNFLQHLMQLGQQKKLPMAVQAKVFSTLKEVQNLCRTNKHIQQAAYYDHMIASFLRDPSKIQPYEAPTIPDGSPIGVDQSCGYYGG